VCSAEILYTCFVLFQQIGKFSYYYLIAIGILSFEKKNEKLQYMYTTLKTFFSFS